MAETTIYITKYALTKGVLKTSVVLENEGTAKVNGFLDRFFLSRQDFFYSESDALAYAENQREKKLKSLHKQIEKLKTKKIKVKEINQI